MQIINDNDKINIIPFPTGKPNVSYSEIKIFHSCPHMYKLKYIDKIGEDKGNVYTAFGKIIHDKCQSFFTTKEMNIELTLKEIKEQWEKEGYGDIEGWSASAVRTLNEIPGWFDTTFPTWKPVAAEQLLFEKIENHEGLSMKGFIDAVIVVDKKKRGKTEGRELSKSYEKTVVLATIDDAWKEHLREMDELKQSVQNATYEQKDPLLIYKFESFELFKTMITKVNKDVAATLMKGHIPTQDPEQVKEAQRRRQLDMSNMRTSRSDSANPGADAGQDREKKTEPVRVDKKVGRNDPCPCGSGKKYKQCHGLGQGASV